MEKPVFRTIESKKISYLRLWIVSTFISVLILCGIAILIITIIPDSFILSIPIEELLLAIVLSIIILNTLYCEGRKYYLTKSKTKYTKVIINNTGIIFTNEYNQTIIAKILWKNIQHRIHEKFDIDVEYSEGTRYFSTYFLWNLSESSDSKIPQWSAIQFATMFSKFKNTNELFKTFLKGIVIFRPDISVNPHFFVIAKLDPNTLEKDTSLIKTLNRLTFWIIIFSILMSLLITLLIIIFS